MKKLIVMIIVIAALWGLYVLNSRGNSELKKKEINTAVSATRPDPKNATYNFEGEEITLTDGKNERPLLEGGGLMEETELTDMIAFGDLNSDGREDSAALLAKYGAGSGIFIYIGAVVSGPIKYKGTNAIFVGDRIVPQSIKIEKGLITVKYLDRQPEEPLAAQPTTPVTKEFRLQSGELMETI